MDEVEARRRESHMEGRKLCDWEITLHVPRWSSFNHNYKGLVQEQMDFGGRGMQGWRVVTKQKPPVLTSEANAEVT